MSTPFNLHRLAREVVNATSEESAHEMVKQLRLRIPAEKTEDALTQALYPVIHEAIKATRHAAADDEPSATAPNGSGKPQGSTRAHRVKEMWRRELEARYSIDGAGTERMIINMNVLDLQHVIRTMSQQIDGIMRNRDRLSRLLAEVNAAGVIRVRDLPDASLRRIFG